MTLRRATQWALVMAMLLVGCSDDKNTLLGKHVSKKRKEEAQEHWDSVRGGVKLQLARQHLQSGRLEEAEKIINQAVALSQKEPQAFVLLARLRLEQGQLAEARAAVSRASALAPENAEISYLSGVIAQRYGDLEMAAEHYTAAARATPNVVDYVLAQAETLVALDRNLDALELVESRISDFDTSAPMQMLAARICRTVGLRQPAVDHCHEALNLAPDDRMLAADCGQIFVWAERYSDAVSVLAPLLQNTMPANVKDHRAARKSDPPTRSLRRCLAGAYVALGKSADALSCIRSVLEDHEADPASLMLCAQAALNVEDAETAGRALALLHDKSPETAETLLLDGYFAFLRIDYVKALDLANRAMQLDARLVPAHCLKGRCAQAIGKLEEARLSYAAALALDPRSPVAAAHLAELAPPPRCTAGEGVEIVTPAVDPKPIPITRFVP